MRIAKNRRTRRSAEAWREIFASHRASGLSARAFCEGEGIAPSSFAKWKRRLAEPAGVAACLRAPSLRRSAAGRDTHRQAPWIELKGAADDCRMPLVRDDEGGWLLEVDMGGGMRLRLRRAA